MRPGEPAPFVVGVSRSGTTLLRLMLDAHPELAIPPETHFIPEAIAAVRESQAPADAFCTLVTQCPRWADFELSNEELAKRVKALEPFVLGEAIRIFYRLYAQRFAKSRWGDKTPRYLRHMSTVESLLPEARFVHVIRDGRDVACSVVPLGWAWGPSSVAEAAAWWRDGIENARRQGQVVAAYLEVRFEDLVVDTERALIRVCDFVSLPFAAAMLEYHRQASERMAELDRDLVDEEGQPALSGIQRRAMHRMTGSPPRPDRVARWRSEMTTRGRREFETIAGALLEELGYPLSAGGT